MELKDRIAITISLVALFISIVAPIATYYWLDPKIKEIRDERLIYKVLDSSQHWKVQPRKSDVGSSVATQIIYNVELWNVGKLPVKNVTLVLAPRLERNTMAFFSNGVPVDRHNDDYETFVNYKEPIGPGEVVYLSVRFAKPTGFKTKGYTPAEEAKEREKEDEEDRQQELSDARIAVWVFSEVGQAKPID